VRKSLVYALVAFIVAILVAAFLAPALTEEQHGSDYSYQVQVAGSIRGMVLCVVVMTLAGAWLGWNRRPRP
jgi:hypothetical protein